MPRKALFLVVLAALLAVPASASALTVSRAQLQSGQLRVEGSGAAGGATVTVSSATSTASNRADAGGAYRVEGSSFRSADCKVTVSDGGRTATATATLSGCTPSGGTTTPPPTTTQPPPPTSTCTITPEPAASIPVGDLNTFFVSTTGCRTSNSPVKWNLVAGSIPPGMTGPFTQGVSSGGITGRPTTVGTYTFTLQVTDFTGARDTETFTINVTAARPVTITTTALNNGTVGQFYCCGNLFADGGTPGYTWTIRAGAIPPGLSLQASPGRITGTPTTRGTFTFTVRATDTRGAFAEKQFSIVIS